MTEKKIRLKVGSPVKEEMIAQFASATDDFDTEIYTEIGPLQLKLLSITYNDWNRETFTFFGVTRTEYLVKGFISNIQDEHWVQVTEAHHEELNSTWWAFL